MKCYVLTFGESRSARSELERHRPQLLQNYIFVPIVFLSFCQWLHNTQSYLRDPFLVAKNPSKFVVDKRSKWPNCPEYKAISLIGMPNCPSLILSKKITKMGKKKKLYQPSFIRMNYFYIDQGLKLILTPHPPPKKKTRLKLILTQSLDFVALFYRFQ